MLDRLYLHNQGGRYAWQHQGQWWDVSPIPLAQAVVKARIERLAPSLHGAFLQLSNGCKGLLTVWRDDYRQGTELWVQQTAPADNGKLAEYTDKIALVGNYLVYCPTQPSKIKPSPRLSGQAMQSLLDGLSVALADKPGEWRLRTLCSADRLADIVTESQQLYIQWLAIQQGQTITDTRPLADLVKEAAFVVTDSEVQRRQIARLLPDKPCVYQEDMQSLLDAAQQQLSQEAASRTITLPQGVNLVFDTTQAAVVVDVNAGSYLPAMSAPAAAMQINALAAAELVRQLRLRHAKGMILVDFVSVPRRYQGQLMEQIRQYASLDPALRVHDLTELGIVELTRHEG